MNIPVRIAPGAPCRGSVGMIPTLPGGLGPSAPYSPVQLIMGMGVRYRVMNLG